jgi:hypothetical protein
MKFELWRHNSIEIGYALFSFSIDLFFVVVLVWIVEVDFEFRDVSNYSNKIRILEAPVDRCSNFRGSSRQLSEF